MPDCPDGPNGDQTSAIYADGNTGGTAARSTTSPWTVTATPQVKFTDPLGLSTRPDPTGGFTMKCGKEYTFQNWKGKMTERWNCNADPKTVNWSFRMAKSLQQGVYGSVRESGMQYRINNLPKKANGS